MNEVETHPAAQDGRNIDRALGKLEGEGALQRARELRAEEPYERLPWRREATGDENSYYGLPLLKESVWKWPIPTYFYLGGLAGASAALSAAALLRGGALRRLARAGRFIAAGGAAASAGLLIEDLGIRSRFIYMLRVFRPTSPMNLGTWILTAFGTASGASLLPGRIGDAACVAAGALGLPLTAYTGVLLSNTAVPFWQEGRAELPPVFVASAAASAASAMEMMRFSRREERVVRRLAMVGKFAELFTDLAFERRVSRIERVGLPLRQGVSGVLWRAAMMCKAASLVVSMAPRKPRWLRVAGGALGTVGALATRFALFHGGKASARDPHAALLQQRAGFQLAPSF